MLCYSIAGAGADADAVELLAAIQLCFSVCMEVIYIYVLKSRVLAGTATAIVVVVIVGGGDATAAAAKLRHSK